MRNTDATPVKGLTPRELADAIQMGEITPTRGAASIDYLISQAVDTALDDAKLDQRAEEAAVEARRES